MGWLNQILPDGVAYLDCNKSKFEPNHDYNLIFKSSLSSRGLNETDIACCCTFQSPGSYLIEHWELINLIAAQTHNLFYGWKTHFGCMVNVPAYCSMPSKTRRNKYHATMPMGRFIHPANLLSIKQYWTIIHKDCHTKKAPILSIFQDPGRCIGFLEEKLWN